MPSYARLRRHVAHLPDEQAIIAVLEALSSDAELRDRFVLKGGNALRHAFDGPRASVDVDLSAVEPAPGQSDAESRAALKAFCERLDGALRGVASEYGYARMLVQSSTVQPAGKDPREFPSFEVKVGYSTRSDRDPPYSDVVKLEVTLNEIVCEAEYRPVGRSQVHISSLDDIIAEKLRALLQQVVRNRNRPGDVFDVWFFTTRFRRALDPGRIARFLQAKSEGREGLGRITRQMFRHAEVRARAQVGYEEIEERLPASVALPPFEEAFAAVLEFVSGLDLPEGAPGDLIG